MLTDTRKIAAILAADVVGYSRLMQSDEEGTLAALKLRRAIFEELVTAFGGREFGSVGDSLMAQFPSALNAVRCAASIQQRVAQTNASLPADTRMALRIGVNLGDVIDENGALFGDGVNVAARLQALADPGGVLVSAAVYEQVKGKLDARLRFAGTHHVKNIAEPVRAWALAEPAAGELTRRLRAVLVSRVALASAAYVLFGAFSVWLMARLAADADLSAWIVPAWITALAASFVPAMALVWHSGRRRSPAWVGYAAFSVATLAACSVAWIAWRGYFEERARLAVTRPAVKAQPVVAVAALRNLTGDAELEWLREGVANLVRDGLTESRHLIVVSPRRWQAVLRGDSRPAPSPEDVLNSAARAGIDYVVSGEFLRGPQGLLLTARVTDVGSGLELVAQRTEGLTPQTLLGEATRLALLAKRGLGIPHTESVSTFSADFAVRNMASYEAYLNGLQYFLDFHYRDAEASFRTALELAPDFHMARYRLAHVQVAAGDTEAALASLDAIPADAPLSRRERLYIEAARALFARDAGVAIARYQALLREFPYDVEARYYLVLAHDLAFDDEAAIGELRRILDQEPENDYIWSYLGETYLRLGEYARAREALDRYMELKPRDPFGFTVLGQLEQLTGNAAAAASSFSRALALDPRFVPARLALARMEVLSDRWEEAERTLRGLTSDAAAPAAFRIDAAFDLAALLRASGRFRDSLEPLQQLEQEIRREHIRDAMALAERGIALAEVGRFDDAAKLIDLAVERSPGAATRYLFARGLVRLMRGDAAGAAAAAGQIRAQREASDASEQGRVARENAIRAATYLEGMATLSTGRTEEAAALLEKADALPGYQYALYKLGLARAVRAQGRGHEALSLARAAATERDSGNVRLDDMRLDLELDRARAVLLEADLLAELGQRELAAERAQRFLRRWRAPDPRQPDRVRAERLLLRHAANAGRPAGA